MPLSIIFDAENRDRDGWLSSFLSTSLITGKRALVRGDRNLPIQLRPVVRSNSKTRPWKDDHQDGDSYKVAIGRLDAVPTYGQFRVGWTTAAVLVTNAGHSAANGTYTDRGEFNGKRYYNLLGRPDDSNSYSISWVNDAWEIRDAGGDTLYAAVGDTEYPWLVDSWSLDSGPPTVSVLSSVGLVSIDDLDGIAAALGELYGPVQVTLSSPGVFEVVWNTAGAVPPLEATDLPNTLSPDSIVSFNVKELGSTSDGLKAVQYVILRQSPMALATPATELPDASVNATIAQAGDSTHNKVYTISLTEGTYTGNFSISVTDINGITQSVGLATPAITANALATLLAKHTGIAESDLSVTRDGDVLTVEFIGTQALSNVPAVAVTNVDLVAPKGVSGIIQLNTTSLYRAFWNTAATTLDFVLVVKRTRASTEEAEILHHKVTLSRNIIDVSTMVSVGGVDSITFTDTPTIHWSLTT